MARAREQRNIEAIYSRHMNTVYRVCYSFMGNAADSEDATQSVFVKLMSSGPRFTSSEHEKAWLIRVASNHCKDVLKSAACKTTSLDRVAEPIAREEGFDMVLDVVLALDPKYKVPVYLHYYEGYSAVDIARLLEKPASTIRSHLSEARTILRRELGEGRS